jgi:hypothetical protein
MPRYAGIIAATVLFVFPSGASAQMNPDPQILDVSINQDGSAKAVWTVPINTRSAEGTVSFPAPLEFGTSGGTRYQLINVLDDSKHQVSLFQTGEQEYGYQLPSGSSGYKTFYLSENVTPMFNGPFALYEFWTFDTTLSTNPKTIVHFPSGWSVATAWPQTATSSQGVVSWDMPLDYRPYRPLVLLLQTNRTGVIEHSGRFVIAGSPGDVQLVKQALALMPSPDTFLPATLGITAPDQVFVIIDDLTKVDSVGFEAEALAANPNIIIYNSRFSKNRTPEEVAETLSHELAHLAMFKAKIFMGGLDYLRWLDEGVAVAYADAAHKRIFTDSQKRAINEELGRTHSVSPLDAETLYEDRFDFSFDGSRALGLPASYRHAGLVFARLGDAAGAKGFTGLFTGLQGAKLTYDPEIDKNLVLAIMERASGLTEKQLLYPGREERDTAGIVTRIAHPDNTTDTDIAAVVAYIKGVHHYFAGGSTTPAPTESASSTTPTPVSTIAPQTVPLTVTLRIGSKGSQVKSLQAFLVNRGFLVAGTSKEGSFDKVLQKAVIGYQKSMHIAATGTVGPATRAAINRALGL